MDEGTGVLAKDVVGGNNGSLIGGASWMDGRFGKAIRFDGTSGFVSTKQQEKNWASMARNQEP